MNNPRRMKVSGIDANIENLINTLNDNMMMPFSSCSGAMQDHVRNGKVRDCMGFGEVHMLDTEVGRNFFAALIGNPNYELSISTTFQHEIYGNDVGGVVLTMCYLNHDGKGTQMVEKDLQDFLEGRLVPRDENREAINCLCDKCISRKIERGLESRVTIFNKEEDGKSDTIYGLEIKSDRKNLSRVPVETIADEWTVIDVVAARHFYTKDPSRISAVLDKALPQIAKLKHERVQFLPGAGSPYTTPLMKKARERINKDKAPFEESLTPKPEFECYNIGVDDLLAFFGNDDGEID